MKTKSKIRVLELEGTPKERGRIHGETLAPQVHEALERYKNLLKLTYNENPDSLIDQFLENTNFLPSIKKWAPQLLEEVEGVADGVGMDFEEIYAMHLAAHDEKWWFDHREQEAESCSAFGCYKEAEQPALLAQNMDLLQLFEGLEVLLHIKYYDSPIEAFVLSHAGFLAECGLNNQPIGICCNSLTGRLNNSIDGLPVTFIVRSVLEQSSLDKAVAFIHAIKHASGQNYTMGDSERVICLECSANKVSEYKPYNDARRVYHTNHPLVNDDKIITNKRKYQRSTTEQRFDYLESRLRDPEKKITVETAMGILSSHFGPVCTHHNSQPLMAYTYSSVIYSLSTPPTLYITVGPPCLTEYERFNF